jgi:clan AA aspartic protease
MITSSVNHNLELVLHVSVHAAANQAHQIEFVIDTGFAGQLSLPSTVVATFGFPFVSQIMTKLSDGTVITVPAHSAVVLWDGAVRIVRVLASAGGVPLLGMEMLRDFDLRARCRPGGHIEIEKAP